MLAGLAYEAAVVLQRAAVSGDFRDQVFRFGLLIDVSILYDFFQDTSGPIGITHIQVGARKVEFGADFITLMEQALSKIFLVLVYIQIVEIKI